MFTLYLDFENVQKSAWKYHDQNNTWCCEPCERLHDVLSGFTVLRHDMQALAKSNIHYGISWSDSS